MLSLQHNGKMPYNSALQLSFHSTDSANPQGLWWGKLLNNQESEAGLCAALKWSERALHKSKVKQSKWETGRGMKGWITVFADP